MLAQAPIDPAAKLECVSYAPFRAGQTPLDSDQKIPPAQIEEDLRQLAAITNCVRTYSVDNGLDQVPALARKVGLKVIHGIGLSGERLKNKMQVDTSLALVKQFPDVIIALVVGNEVLLRGEMTASDLAATIRYVKAQARGVPVTYADVWEFWLRYREVYDAVDFVTIHILPYWEDFPIPARNAAAHVDSIRKQVAIAFPNKEILIGETGWPSAGRMREGALPSRTNQARVISEILSLARAEKFRVNLIEAYDQPWKRQLEGTVGGHWGLFDADRRNLKYPAGQSISDFPHWKLEAGAGVVFVVLVFLAGFWAQRRKPWTPRLVCWIGTAIAASAGGTLLGFAVEKLLVESLNVGLWLKWGALFAAGIAAPFLCAIAALSGRSLPTFTEMLGPREQRDRSLLAVALGAVLMVTAVIGAETALGFVFDPRYQDFPYAALSMAVIPLAMLTALNRRTEGVRQITECAFAGLFALSAFYISFNETFRNWQSDWTCAVYVLLALTLWQARGVRIQAAKAP